jgi:hypothetical protein
LFALFEFVLRGLFRRMDADTDTKITIILDFAAFAVLSHYLPL